MQIKIVMFKIFVSILYVYIDISRIMHIFDVLQINL